MDQEGTNLISKQKLPDPLMAKMPESLNMSSYKNFSEKKFDYSFKNIIYLYQAFTHPSYSKNRYTASYQK